MSPLYCNEVLAEQRTVQATPVLLRLVSLIVQMHSLRIIPYQQLCIL